ncbi:MAG: Uma2 family endonuclease [Planctomycetia bacterium]|nr:Uma2 family endonuclease [Planctomycetia bacterium]
MASETRPSDFSLNEPLPDDFELDIDHLVTEDDAPVDNIYSEKQQRLLTEPLHSSWKRDSGAPFVAFANVGLFYKLHGALPYVPDAMLSLDVELPGDIWKKQNRSYFVWEYGKPPEVVVEVVSNREGGEEDRKLKGYAQIGVKYYVIHDPEKQLSLGLKLWEGTYEDRTDTWLRWYDAHGELIPTGAERADAAEHRADKLAEQLRQLGIEPEA